MAHTWIPAVKKQKCRKFYHKAFFPGKQDIHFVALLSLFKSVNELTLATPQWDIPEAKTNKIQNHMPYVYVKLLKTHILNVWPI